MNAELKAKFLQYLNQKKQDQGFTLTELLIVIIIIGILYAIALPSFLNQANKGKQSEAKVYVGSLNEGQQAYFLENGRFAANVAQMGIDIQTQTANYTYGTSPFPPMAPPGTTDVYATSYSSAVSSAPFKNYSGKVYVTQLTGNTTDAVLLTFLCESQQAGDFNGNISTTSCPPGWNQVGK